MWFLDPDVGRAKRGYFLSLAMLGLVGKLDGGLVFIRSIFQRHAAHRFQFCGYVEGSPAFNLPGFNRFQPTYRIGID